MRLSTAIAMGRTLVTDPRPNDITRCALGMAAKGAGIPVTSADDVYAYLDIKVKWPWLISARTHCPHCDKVCWGVEVVWHIFDYHVANQFGLYKSCTLDQLIDYVRSIEPQEDDLIDSNSTTRTQTMETTAGADALNSKRRTR